MREKASTIFACTAFALALSVASVAEARPVKPAARHAAPVASAHTRAHAEKAVLTHVSRHAEAVSARKSSKAGRREESAKRDISGKHDQSIKVAGRNYHGEAVAVARHHAAPPVVDEPEAPVEASSPEPHVKHNRKLHLSDPADESPAAADTPHKLTSDDFMAPAVAREAVATTPALATEAKPNVVAKPALVSRSAPAPILPARNIKAAIATITDDGPKPAAILMPALFDRRGRLIVPAALKGSHEILLHQNEVADEEHLTRVQDDDDLDRLRGARQIVALPVSAALAVDERLPANRRYCRPWTAQFLTALSRAHYARFHSALQVNSAVRTVEFQERLRYTNGNAAPSEGATASPHLTGQAVDLAKHGLSMTEIAWLRGYLLPLVQQGKVDVEEEFQQSCFHISVYKKYLPQAAPRRLIDHPHSPATALAAAIR